MASWAAILVACALLCANSETRDMLLGRGRALTMVGLAVMVTVLGLTVAGWSLT